MRQSRAAHGRAVAERLGAESAKTAFRVWKIRSFPCSNRGKEKSAPLKYPCVSRRYEQRKSLREGRLLRRAPERAPPKNLWRLLLRGSYQIDMLLTMNNSNVSILHSAAWFERTVHGRAVDTENVIFTDHARERLNQRSITLDEAIRVLRHGRCADERRSQPGRMAREYLVDDRRARTLRCGCRARGKKLVVITAWELKGEK